MYFFFNITRAVFTSCKFIFLQDKNLFRLRNITTSPRMFYFYVFESTTKEIKFKWKFVSRTLNTLNILLYADILCIFFKYYTRCVHFCTFVQIYIFTRQKFASYTKCYNFYADIFALSKQMKSK